MMKKIVTLGLALLAATASFAQNLERFTDKKGKKGFKDGKKTVIPATYDEAGQFNEGLASVKQNGKWGAIDATGKEVIPFEYDAVNYNENGLLSAKKDGKWGRIDKTGKVVIPIKYGIMREDAFGSTNYVVMENNLWGVIDKDGNEVIAIKYEKMAQSGHSPTQYSGKQGSTTFIFSANGQIISDAGTSFQSSGSGSSNKEVEKVQVCKLCNLKKPRTGRAGPCNVGAGKAHSWRDAN